MITSPMIPQKQNASLSETPINSWGMLFVFLILILALFELLEGALTVRGWGNPLKIAQQFFLGFAVYASLNAFWSELSERYKRNHLDLRGMLQAVLMLLLIVINARSDEWQVLSSRFGWLYMVIGALFGYSIMFVRRTRRRY